MNIIFDFFFLVQIPLMPPLIPPTPSPMESIHEGTGSFGIPFRPAVITWSLLIHPLPIFHVNWPRLPTLLQFKNSKQVLCYYFKFGFKLVSFFYVRRPADNLLIGHFFLITDFKSYLHCAITNREVKKMAYYLIGCVRL